MANADVYVSSEALEEGALAQSQVQSVALMLASQLLGAALGSNLGLGLKRCFPGEGTPDQGILDFVFIPTGRPTDMLNLF